MFRSKLYLAFFLLLAITLLQAGLAIWASSVASYHVERSRVANQMLAEFITLGADKQRLKVWLAQSLLVKDTTVEQREKYLGQMQQSLINLNHLLQHDQRLSEHPEDFSAIGQQLKSLSILETNVAALKQSLRNKQVKPEHEAQIWRLLIQTFDNLEGLDLKHLISDSIELQRKRSAEAETKAASALQRVKLLVIAVALFGAACAVMLALVLSRALYQPIQQLLTGTSALSNGQLNYRLPEQDHSEFSTLARSFNHMAAGLERARQQEEDHTRRVEQEVTERTRQLQHALEQLQQAEQQQQRFLADVSHELRTPATAIRGEAEISLRGGDKSPDFYKDSLLRIADTSAQLSRRIDDLLMLVRGSQQLQLQFRTVQLADLWQQLHVLTQRLSSSQSVPIICSALPPATNVRLWIDPDKLLQALQIILDNAIRYSNARQPVHVAVQVDEQCRIAIKDCGIGIAPDDLPLVFNRYFRARNARNLRPDGLGIGLSLCDTLIRGLHGNIELVSEQHTGTTVTVILPLIEEDDDANPDC
ncbi:MAG TPA: ATP-binding protein [Cellvibrio sp.]